MNPEQEAELFTTLGRMEEKLDAAKESLITHTNQDTTNFAKLERGQDHLHEAIDALRLKNAKASGMAEEAARHASTSGGKWGAAMGAFVSAVVAVIMAMFGRP